MILKWILFLIHFIFPMPLRVFLIPVLQATGQIKKIRAADYTVHVPLSRSLQVPL